MRARPFVCFADGTVGVVGESTVLGKYLTVRHADGYETLYAHCSKITVSSGQSVLRGDTLGAVGATGNATGRASAFRAAQRLKIPRSHCLCRKDRLAPTYA